MVMVQPTPHITVGFLILCVHFWEVRLYYETLESFVVYGFVLFSKWLSLIKVGPSWKRKSLYFFDLHLSKKIRKSSLGDFSDCNRWSIVLVNPNISSDRLNIISADSQHYLRPLLVVHPGGVWPRNFLLCRSAIFHWSELKGYFLEQDELSACHLRAQVIMSIK